MTWRCEEPPTFRATASRISERSSPKSLLWTTLAPLCNSFRDYAARFSGRSSPKSAVRCPKIFSVYLYSYSYVLATSAFNNQYLNKFYHYYLFMPFILHAAIDNFQFKNVYFFVVLFVEYKNLYFFVVVPLADVS